MLKFASQEQEQGDAFLEHQEQKFLGHLFQVSQWGASEATISVPELPVSHSPGGETDIAVDPCV